MCFQYDSNGTPFGFVYNNSQYFYLTNQMNDVVGITDINGNLVAQYEYDEWGNALSVTDNDVANANPIRYRGYYYDNETGYYYLQSRYYDPAICRFINADVPEITKVSEETINGVNIFLYCDNEPIDGRDTLGYFDWNSLKNKIGNFISKMKDKVFAYFKSQFNIDGSTITIGATLMAAVFDTIASVVFTVVVAKALSGTIKAVTKSILNKSPAKFKNLINGIFNFIKQHKICNFLAEAILFVATHKAAKKIVSTKYSLSKSVQALAKDMVLSMFELKETLLGKLIYVVSAFTSIGGILALILDLCDLKLNQKLVFTFPKIKKALTC